jgi:hypothetical protein
MTLTINLDDETERVIHRRAARLGISPAAYLERLAQRTAQPREHRAQSKHAASNRSAAEALKEFISSVHGKPGPRPGVA